MNSRGQEYFQAIAYREELECSWTFHVELRAPRYVSLGSSAILKCDYSVSHEMVHKVEWLRHGKKIFQYVKGRRPPFRNYTIPGAHMDWTSSNERQLSVRNLDFDASGAYSCEVTTETPIYTKPSEEREMTVVQSQMEDPRISFRKPTYSVGDWIEVNCTSAPANPTPHVTWLLNGKQVEKEALKSFKQKRTSTVTTQLRFQIQEDHREQLELTCLATIPNFLGHDATNTEYADHRAQSIAIEVKSPPPELNTISDHSRSSSCQTSMSPLQCLAFLLLLVCCQTSLANRSSNFFLADSL
ncbi:hypothetical protein LSTR_LSTR011197 [Laodelphax striatellus]|uniref:Ig-like domain-containing protein n=1 Tax=Laodelphax striatellus TaxID=195883 RepID=A0A482X3Q0_LAOST|nr:hypothetical protein LSTR_LSTR011197 [Laodelphax striatellus]